MDLKLIGVFATIPFVLAVPPMLGWWIGSWLDELMGTAPLMLAVLIIFGAVAGLREVVRLVKKFGQQ